MSAMEMSTGTSICQGEPRFVARSIAAAVAIRTTVVI